MIPGRYDGFQSLQGAIKSSIKHRRYLIQTNFNLSKVQLKVKKTRMMITPNTDFNLSKVQLKVEKSLTDKAKEEAFQSLQGAIKRYHLWMLLPLVQLFQSLQGAIKRFRSRSLLKFLTNFNLSKVQLKACFCAISFIRFFNFNLSKVQLKAAIYRG